MGVIAAVTAIAGVGTSIYGAQQSYSASKDAAAATQQQIAAQQRQEALRRQQMELEARRRQLEITRQQQRSRALALTNANAQGGLLGSGLQGGFGQISGQANTQQLALGQNLGIGEQIFGTNQDISNSRISYANSQSQAAFGSGLSAIGGTLINSMGAINRLGAGFGSGASANPYYQNAGYAGSAYNYSRPGSLY